MESLVSLWLPILVSAVGVFVASSVLHMLLKYHQADYRKLPQEDAVADALRGFEIPPGDYMLPRGEGAQEMNNPEFIAKMERGPVLMMTVWKPGPPAMGGSLAQWFVFCVIVSIFAAYLAGIAVPAGGEYLAVFRVTGTVAFAGYALAEIPYSIWYRRSWATTARNLFDGLVYAGLTAGVFGWLWPAAV